MASGAVTSHPHTVVATALDSCHITPPNNQEISAVHMRSRETLLFQLHRARHIRFAEITCH